MQCAEVTLWAAVEDLDDLPHPLPPPCPCPSMSARSSFSTALAMLAEVHLHQLTVGRAGRRRRGLEPWLCCSVTASTLD